MGQMGFYDGFCWLGHNTGAARASAPRPMPVSVAAAVRQDVPIYVSGPSCVRALPIAASSAWIDALMASTLACC
jgi:hypothetical protein